MAKNDTTKQPGPINTFNVGNVAPNKPKLQHPQQHVQMKKAFPSKSDFRPKQSKPTQSEPTLSTNASQEYTAIKPFKRNAVPKNRSRTSKRKIPLLQLSTDRRISSNVSTILPPEDHPPNLEVQLILTLLMSPQ